MVDAKQTPKQAEPKARDLAPASEATDPAVHQVLAEIQTAQMNGDTDRVADLNRQLADLGYC